MDLRVAAYGVVTDDADRVLLARWTEGRRVAWTMPGGGLEAGEDPEDAVRRELRYPPAVRVAGVTGGRDEVARAIATLDDLPGIDVLGPAPVSDAAREGSRGPGGAGIPGGRGAAGAALQRASVRFDYGRGAEGA